jgi:hypothetical protein
MNPRWLLVRRLRGPAYLLTFGLTALLNQWDVLSFGQSWPLYLIVAGVLTLAERAALTSLPYAAPYGPTYGDPNTAQAYAGQQPTNVPYQAPGSGVVPYAPVRTPDSDPGSSGRS